MSDSPKRMAFGGKGMKHELSKSQPITASNSFISDFSDDVTFTQSSKSGNIKVVCRFRPINERERTMNLGTCVDFHPDGTQVTVTAASEGGGEPLTFSFDHIFPPATAQSVVYDAAAKPIIESVLEGFNGTVFAYGQTGSGKTFTMTGANIDDDCLKGIIPRMITTVFGAILSASEQLEFTVKIGYCEIYMEKIKDLLNPAKNNLKVHEDKSRGVYIADLTEEYVSEEAEVYNLMKIGTANREVAATQMNEGSSRSHSLFIMTVSQNNTLDYSSKTGKLYLVDLAGSEKVGKTGAEGKRLDEAKNINKSLTTLGMVITALTEGKSTHVPYRDSKLTRVLQDSLGGNSKTSLIITCSPSPFNEAETISTLRFGIRAKQIKNKPKVNKEYTVAELKLLLSKSDAEIAKRDRRIAMLEKSLGEAGMRLPSDDILTMLEEHEVEQANPIVPPPEMAEMHQELEETRQKLSLQADQTEEYRLKLLESTTRIRNLLKQRDEMNKQISDLLNTIHELEERNNEMDDQVDKARLMEEAFQAEIAGFEENKADMEGKMKEMEEEIEKLISDQTTRSEAPRRSISRLNSEIDTKDDEIRDLRAKLTSVEALVTHIAVETHESKVQSLIQQSDSLDAKNLISVNQLYEQEKLMVEQLEEENRQLKEDLEEALKDKIANVEDVLSRIRHEALLDTERQIFELKASHRREIESLTQKHTRLINDIESEQENYRVLECTMTEDEKQLKKKIKGLDQSLEQLKVLYSQLANQQSKLKVESQVMDKKLKRKIDENQKLSDDIVKLKKDIFDLHAKESNSFPEYKPRKSHKIKKTLKGGFRHHGLFATLPDIPEYAFSDLQSSKQHSDHEDDHKE